METRKYKHDFFISYKHGEWDSQVSGYLQKKLENYKIPKEIQKKCGKKKIERVFRDKEELSVTLDLTMEIEEQLKNTEYLIVMCSPESKTSRWVAKEVETFVKHRGSEYVLRVLIKGEPEDAFLDSMLEREMLAADLRGKDFKEVKKKCNQEILRLIAPSLGCSFDGLKQRHKANVNKRFALAAAVIALFAVGFGSYSFYQAQMIQENYWQKQKNQAGLLAEKSKQLLDAGDRESALLVALEALPEQEGDQTKPLVGKAQKMLEDALYLYSQKSAAILRPVNTLQMSGSYQILYGLPVYGINEEKNILVSCDVNNVVYIWDLLSGELIFEYKELSEKNEDITHVLMGNESKAYLCTEHKIVCLDYAEMEKCWESIISEYSILEYQLSADKTKIAVEYYESIGIIDVETGSILKEYVLEDDDRSYKIAWSPEGKQLGLLYNGFLEEGSMKVLDLESGVFKTLFTHDQERYGEIAFRDENTLTYVWVEPYQESYYSSCHVCEYDCRTGEILWQIENKCITRNTNMDIQYIKEEAEDEIYDLTVVTIGTAVIGVRNGELWGEYIYDHEIVGTVGSGTGNLHITKDGGLFRLNWKGPRAYTTEYSTGRLDMGELAAAQEVLKGDVVVFPQGTSSTIYIYGKVEDTEYREVENSEEALSIVYTPNGRYRIANDWAGDSNYVLNVWDMKTEKNIFRKEFFYDHENESGEYFKDCGCIGDEYFYYYTEKNISVYCLETLQEELLYTYQPTENEYFNSLENLTAVTGNHSGIYFENGNSEIYFLSLKDRTAEKIWEKEELESLYKQQEDEYVYINLLYTPNPTGEYLMFCNFSYDAEEAETDIYIWSIRENGIAGSFKLLNTSIYAPDNEFYIEFSNDGKLLLFQNSEYGLHIRNLENGSIEELPFKSLDNQKFWFSPDDRFVFTYTNDYFLKVYDRETKQITMNLECDENIVEEWYFDNEDLRFTATHKMSQPVLYSFRNIGIGQYECYSVIANCERIYQGRVYVRPESNHKIYSYPFRTLDDMIGMAKEFLDGRVLTDIERQRYSIDN